MTLQSSGPLKASEIQAEFEGTPPFNLSDYYAGGPNVPSGTVGDAGPIPTSGTIKFSDFYGASNIRVDVVGASLSDVDTSGTVSVGYRLHNNGSEQSFIAGGVYTTFNTWLLVGAAADYDCRLTVNSGSAPAGDTVGVWLGLASSRAWTLTRSTNGTTINSCTIEIRDAVSLDVLDSASVTMEVELSP
jgi:hypothetical protein